jgi:mRNA-degrading endonuclease HigB of HigAB toxin-antitoxin module
MNNAQRISGSLAPDHRPSSPPSAWFRRQRPVIRDPRPSLPHATGRTTPNLSTRQGFRGAMIVVGTSLLAEHAKAHPRSAASLRALNALLQRAAWQAPEDLSRSFGTLLKSSNGDRFVLTLHESDSQIALQVNFAIGIIRILKITRSNKG